MCGAAAQYIGLGLLLSLGSGTGWDEAGVTNKTEGSAELGDVFGKQASFICVAGFVHGKECKQNFHVLSRSVNSLIHIVRNKCLRHKCKPGIGRDLVASSVQWQVLPCLPPFSHFPSARTTDRASFVRLSIRPASRGVSPRPAAHCMSAASAAPARDVSA